MGYPLEIALRIENISKFGISLFLCVSLAYGEYIVNTVCQEAIFSIVECLLWCIQTDRFLIQPYKHLSVHKMISILVWVFFLVLLGVLK